MKKALLHTVMVISAAYCCMSCIYDYYPEDMSDENHVMLALNMRLLGHGPTRAGEDFLSAERISTMRIVIVDLGISCSGEKEAGPSVEYNKLIFNVSPGREPGREGVVQLQFPRIRADRQKKIYFLLNSEQSYLNIECGGTAVNLNNSEIYLPAADGTVPVETATFISPKGSLSQNDIAGELLVPMTAFHSFSIPAVKELEEGRPLNANLVYTVPDELYVVRAINKITFDFVNATKDGENDGIDLLVKSWSISDINTGASYLFARPGNNGNLFAGADNGNLNAPWMQWLRKEADRSRSVANYEPEWLTVYDMPDNARHGEYIFYPAGPGVNEGYVLAAPAADDNTAVAVSTEDDPVYFAESRPVAGKQRYNLAFTVMQKEDGEWNNEYTYRATSSLTAPEGGNDFSLQSLFRSTHVKVTVTFRSVLGHPVLDIDVHPYGGYELDPGFGL